ncbi:MAG: nitrite/sulfite reductase, partial [Pseudomonadota bacterium]
HGDDHHDDLDPAEWERLNKFFAPPALDNDAKRASLARKDLQNLLQKNPAFKTWMDKNTAAHFHDHYKIAIISLKPAGGIPGDATAEQMHGVAALAEQYGFGEIRVTHKQNLVIPHLHIGDLYALWERLVALDLAHANFQQLPDMIACPGMDYCTLANARSIPLAQQISTELTNRTEALGMISINISGCINACGHHHVGNIGILGVDRKGEEYYQITVGGRSDEQANIGKIVGPAFAYDQLCGAIGCIIDTYLAERAHDQETFIAYIERAGIATLKEQLYANNHA